MLGDPPTSEQQRKTEAGKMEIRAYQLLKPGTRLLQTPPYCVIQSTVF